MEAALRVSTRDESRGDREDDSTCRHYKPARDSARPNLNLESIGSATDERREQRHTTVDGRSEARGTGPTHRSDDRRLLDRRRTTPKSNNDNRKL